MDWFSPGASAPWFQPAPGQQTQQQQQPSSTTLFQPSQPPSQVGAPTLAPVAAPAQPQPSASQDPSSSLSMLGAASGGLSGLRSLLGTQLGDALGLGGAGVSGGLQAGSSLLNLLNSIQTGDYSKLPGSLYGLYQGGGGLINAATGTSAVPIVSGGGFNAGNLISALPSVIGLIGGKQMDPMAAGSISGFGQALSAGILANTAMATGSVPYAAIVAQALTDAMGIANLAQGKESVAQVALGSIPIIGSYAQALQHQLDEDPTSWATIGKAATTMGENALSGGQQINGLASLAQQAGITDPRVMQSLVGAESNALFPFYQTIQGPAAPISAGDWLDRVTKANPDLAQQYRDTQGLLQNNIWNTISGLHTGGMTAAQLGATPNVNPLWGDSYLGGDAVHRAFTSQQATPQNATALGGQGGIVVPGSWMSDPGLAALGLTGNFLSPTATNVATGGPLNSMTAALNPTLYSQIGGGFDFSSPAVQGELQPILHNAAMIDQAANQAFTSGGG